MCYLGLGGWEKNEQSPLTEGKRKGERREKRGKENKDDNGPGEEIFIGNSLTIQHSLGENTTSGHFKL